MTGKERWDFGMHFESILGGQGVTVSNPTTDTREKYLSCYQLLLNCKCDALSVPLFPLAPPVGKVASVIRLGMIVSPDILL